MGPDDETTETTGTVEMYDPERDEWVPLPRVSFTTAAAEAERRLLDTTEWVPMDLDKDLRPPSSIFRTPGGLVIDWGWRRLILGRRAWLPMGHPTPTWRLGPVAYYGEPKWTTTTEEPTT